MLTYDILDRLDNKIDNDFNIVINFNPIIYKVELKIVNCSRIINKIICKIIESNFGDLKYKCLSSQYAIYDVEYFCNDLLTKMRKDGKIEKVNGKYVLKEFTKEIKIKDYYIAYASKRN